MDKVMVGIIIGAIFALMSVLIVATTGDWATGQEVINHECAHYDLKTGKFTWNKRIGEE